MVLMIISDDAYMHMPVQVCAIDKTIILQCSAFFSTQFMSLKRSIGDDVEPVEEEVGMMMSYSYHSSECSTDARRWVWLQRVAVASFQMDDNVV